MYVGPWLPEPIRTPGAETLEMMVVQSDLLSYAMLVLLERLKPTERTVFVLREALGFDYPDIAELLGKREANCRKLMSRARSKMGISEEEPVTAEAVELEWINRLLQMYTILMAYYQAPSTFSPLYIKIIKVHPP